jgi:branched-subunit amino acid aminotransferase/4-amino-4-deoxychorismate lyase
MAGPAWMLLGNRMTRGAAAKVPPWSPAVLWGAGLFETVGCQDGVPLLWEAHVARLSRGLARLGWRGGALPDRSRVEQLLQRSGVTGSGVVRLVAQCLGARFRVVSWANRFRPPRQWRQHGVRLATLWVPAGPLTDLKSCAYLAHRWARGEARRAGADAALFIDTDGVVREADAANVFVATGGVVLTPPAPRRCLAGVMRAWCLAALGAAGISVEEGDLTPAEVERAEEVWLTSSLAGLVPVCAVDGRPVPVPRRLVAMLERAGVPAPGYRTG